MKKWLVVLCILFASYTYADQLAYISKGDAEKAVQVISKMKTVYLFCGCCSMAEPRVVEPTKVYTRFTNYEQYYEVVIEYTNSAGKTVTEALDLAYVWNKKRKKYTTIGKILGLEHDFCVQPQNWNKPASNKEE